jgi:hypothetical protein
MAHQGLALQELTFYSILQHFTAYYYILLHFKTFYSILQHFKAFYSIKDTRTNMTEFINQIFRAKIRRVSKKLEDLFTQLVSRENSVIGKNSLMSFF